MSKELPESLSVGDTKFIREDLTAARPDGNRAVAVVDRGWIFAGDVEELGGRIILTRAVWVFRWESIGFDGVIHDPKSPKVQIKAIKQPVEIPSGSEIFRIPVHSEWGL